MLSRRIEDMRDRLRNTTPTICIDRAKIATDYYKEPSVEPFIIRRAKLFERVLEQKQIFIDEDALLVGNIASRRRAVPVFPEMMTWLEEAVETFDTREFDPFQYMPGEKEELRKIAREWKGRTFGDYTDSQISEEEKTLMEIGIMTRGVAQASTMCHAPDYASIVKKGYRYYIDECKKRIEELEDMDIEKMGRKMTWQAMIITLEAIIKFSHRYADLADKLVEESDSDEEKIRLRSISKTCRVVPENPPENFLQAVQLLIFTQDALMMENNGYLHTFGRFDQYMYEFYRRDVERGVPKEYIADIIQEFKLKIEEMWYLRDEFESGAYPGCALYMHIMLGGVKADGTDGCNDLTRLILSGMEDLQTKEPCVSFRYHDDVDEDTFRQAIKVALKGGSHPAFFNDRNCIPALIKLGFTKEEAAEWSIIGCTEPVVPGKSDYQSVMGYFNSIKVFEITLYDGKDPVSGKQVGPHTGDVREFTSIDQLKEAYLKQQEYFVKRFVYRFNKIVSCHAYAIPTITASCFTAGCIEKGKVLQEKGCDHRWSVVALTGLANIADSMAAIDECVFSKKYLSMTELMKLLEKDFQGSENMRQLLLNRAPKYGNDDERVDKYAKFVVEELDKEIKRYKDGRDGDLITLCATQSYNVLLGKMISATPDGRKAFTALADNASPMIGMDVCGPTAVVNSLNSVDPLIPQGGMLLNQRFDPDIVKGEKGIDILETVLRAHFGANGSHMQINVVNDEVLRDAQRHPENYRNMLVRVAGYSAFFVDLEEGIQENIIQRTIQRSV